MLTRSFLLGRPGLIMSRWRPVCPECGYWLRGSSGDRCPECGHPFPTTDRFFRRWACRRLPWDRTARRGRVGALVASALWIMLVPTRAARGLSIPDRWGRAAAWCVVWIVVGAASAAVLGSHWAPVAGLTWPGFGMAADADFRRELWGSPLWRARWAAQSAAIHAANMVLVVALGLAISLLQPRRHPAAKWAGAKWSLYASVVMPVAVAAFSAVRAVALARGMTTIPLLPRTHPFDPAPLPLEIAVVAYTVWWSIGMAAGTFARSRSMPDAFGYAVALGLVYMLARILFPLGALEQLT